MCTLFNVPLYSHQRLQDHLIIINREDLNKAFKNSADWKDRFIRLRCNNSQQTIYALIENDHLADWSTEMDCCWQMTLSQPVLKPSSESSLILKMA